MARFSSFLGRRVEVQYRASDTLLPASGVFVADSGRSIFLEQSFEQRGQHRHFRWEIPYQHLVRIGLTIKDEEDDEGPPLPGRVQSAMVKPEMAKSEVAMRERSGEKSVAPLAIESPDAGPSPLLPKASPTEQLAAGAAAGLGMVSGILPMSNRSKA